MPLFWYDASEQRRQPHERFDERSTVQVGEFCDSGKPWYCFFGVYLVTLIVNITLLLTSEQKPKWWSVALDVCGLALAASNIAKTEMMQKGRHNT